VRLDQDILTPLAGKKKLYTFETADFWEQLKTPGMSLRCSLLYLHQYRQTSLELLAVGDGTKSPTIVGDVFIHRSAKVHPSAKVFFQAHLTVLFFLNICIDSRNMKIETQGLRVFEGNSSGSKSKTRF
jgi:hypothetical protein